jgi:hypothetical protein
VTDQPRGQEEATRAAHNAEQQLQNVRSQWRLVHLFSSLARLERQENHFAERIREAMEGEQRR